MPPPFTLIADGHTTTVDAVLNEQAVRLPPPAVRAALGWTLEPEGLCRDGVCLPIRGHADLVTDAGIDLDALARLLDRPLALDVESRAAALGDSVAAQRQRLDSLEAPDVELPDLDGQLHHLVGFRGKKILLIAWASW